ncbi:MAG: GFA family protein [Hyphomicrobiales bacterium]|nr:GFA family protein [Hyphomicrobiales bacterium]
MPPKYSGKCHCGDVTYVANGAPKIIAKCHCNECRRLSGTGHTIGAMFRISDVTIKGKLSKYKYVSAMNSEVTKAFCSNCGSPVYGANTRLPDHLTISLGTMDEANGLNVEVVIFERDKQKWDCVAPGTPSFETQPDWKPTV